MADAVETADALAVADEAATRAAAVVREAYADPERGRASRKRPRDFVSEVDEEAEAAILEVLGRAFPGHAVLAEESGSTEGEGRFRWVVDPLDGTTNFLHRFPAFAVSIALTESGRPIVGLVVDPLRGERFKARAGEGAVLARSEGTRRALAVTEPAEPTERLVATGFPFRHPDQLDRYLSAFRAVFERVGDLRRAGSAALDLAYVAAGRVDGFWELGLNPWDTAAGELLVLEAGGLVSDWSGGDGHRASGWIVAGGPGVHAALVDALARFA